MRLEATPRVSRPVDWSQSGLVLSGALLVVGCGQVHTVMDGGENDAGAPLVDSGPPPLFDASPPPLDAGPPPLIDSGPPALDAGPLPLVDAGPDSGLTPSRANPIEHCRARGFWLCRRDNFAGRTNQDEFEACLAPIESMCAGVAWPSGCAPTVAEADECISLLMAGEHLQLTNPELLAMFDQCNLCP